MASKSVTENHLKTGGESLDFQNKIEVTNKVSEACYETFQAMKLRRKHRYIIFKLGEDKIEVESTGERKSVRFIFSSFATLCSVLTLGTIHKFLQTYESFKAALPFTDCRFCVYDQDYTTPDGRHPMLICFFFAFTAY